MSSMFVLLCLLVLGFTPNESLLIDWKQTSVLRATPGDNVNLDCATADATVSLWHTNAQGIEKKLSPSNGKLTKSGSKFTLLNVSLSDYGLYKCKVVNGGYNETITKKFQLFHARKSTVKVDPLSQVIETGSYAIIICYTTIKKPVWYKMKKTNAGDVPVAVPSLSDRYTVTLLSDEYNFAFQSTLHFKNVTKSDAGLYKCLNIYARLAVRDPQPPAIWGVSPGPNVQVSAGGDTTLDCIAVGFPTPKVIWLKDTAPLALCDREKNVGCVGNPRYFMSDKTGLTIKNVQYPQDHGKFMCLATNDAGHDSGVINVNVRVAPKMGNNAVLYKRWDEAEINIKCNVEYSNPTPRFTWKYRLTPAGVWGDVSILPTNDKSGLLHIHKGFKLPDTIYFKCKASNSEGSDSAEFKVEEFKSKGQ